MTVGEPALALVQFRFVVYCARLLTLPAAITSFRVTAAPDDMVATPDVNPVLPVPDEVAVLIAAPEPVT